MNSKNAPLFRTAVSGFNKKDVNDYIAKLCKESDERESEKEREIESLNAKIAEHESQIKELSEAAKNTPAPSEPVCNDEVKSDALSEAEAIIAAQNEKLAEYEEKNIMLTLELEEANKKRAEAEEKLGEYGSMTTRMGEIFMEAAADADRIRRDAKTSSEQLAKAAAEECRKRQADIYKKLDEFAVARRFEINKLFEQAQGTINVALRDFENKARGLSPDSVSEATDDFESVQPANEIDE